RDKRKGAVPHEGGWTDRLGVNLAEAMAIRRSALTQVVANSGNEAKQQKKCPERTPPGSRYGQEEDGQHEFGNRQGNADWARHPFGDAKSGHGAARSVQVGEFGDT